MRTSEESSALRYVAAAQVQSPVGDLTTMDLRTADDRPIGHLDGVVIDPVERRLRFYVVRSVEWLGGLRYLVPTDWLAQVDPAGHSLRVNVGPEALAGCELFDRSAVPKYSDEDLLAAMFHRRIA